VCAFFIFERFSRAKSEKKKFSDLVGKIGFFDGTKEKIAKIIFTRR
jgi:hypothetical protein